MQNPYRAQQCFRQREPGFCCSRTGSQYVLHAKYRTKPREVHCLASQQQINSSSHGKRALLLWSSSGAAAAALLLLSNPASANVKLTISRKPQLKEFRLKAGYAVTVPDTWALAYDRSDSAELGTQVFFGDFKTFQTLSIFKLEQPGSDSGVELQPEQLLETFIAEQRDNQSTYGFNLLSGPSPTPRTPAAEDGNTAGTTFYDSEYELAICRGLIEEGSAGRKRCVGPRDMDLQVVSRHFYQSFAVQGGNIYVVRGSATSEQWADVGSTAIQAVQSFRLAQT